MPTCFLVLGTPRSGTSAVAGILHHLGLPMGRYLMAPDVWNPRGYFQDIEFENAVVPPLGGTFPPLDSVSPEDLASGETAVEALAAARAGGNWGLKSNRVAYFLPALVRGAGDVRVIRTSRPVEESAASFAARSGLSADRAAEIVRDTDEAISRKLAECKLTPALTVPYHALLSDARLWVSRVADVAGLPANAAAEQWIDATLRRFRGNAGSE